MARKPKKWPSYALDRLERSLAVQMSIQTKARQAQEALDKGQYVKASLLLGDIREEAGTTRHYLVEARTGEYDEEFG